MNEELLKLRVVDLIAETPDTKTIVLEPADGRAVSYRAGQFLTLLFQHGGHEVRRSYSMSSTPGLDPYLTLTIKRVENGEISRYLLDHLRVGDELDSLPPAGRFTFDSDPDYRRDIVLIGAGSGITPLFALLKQVLSEEPQSHVTLLDCNTGERNIIFRKQLDALQRQHPDRFTLIHLLSRPSDEWTGRRGRLNNWLLEKMLPELTRFDRAAARWYLCGPFTFMRTVQITLVYAGIRREAIRKENFVIEPVTATPPPELARNHRILLRFRGKEYDIDVPAYKSVLQAALDHGVRLPYSCRGGRCSSCTARCVSGSVYMTINDVLTEQDVAEGWVLTCTGYPQAENVVLEV
ncbi:ferredoxin--NADP reductase [Larkinella soli]|uniref:ferredoxin--NADP reductase n=1 Tax=Larkinella soli TaxID=1770527 RepID=UPI000FFC8A7D|nr:ferredoxin--NADP reductase [Larkinella soli]